MPRSSRARRVEAELRRRGSSGAAAGALRFFKTGPGEYGEGDKFFGLAAAQIYDVARSAGDLTLDDLEQLLESPWHESRLVALVVLAHRYQRADPPMQQQIYRLYLRRTDRINNWDLVDVSAPEVVGAHLLKRSRAPLHRLAKSRDLWERRIAIVATQELIRHGEFSDTLRIAVTLLHDPHDLIHKATGWMLREVGKRDERALLRFLDRWAPRLPRTALRYSIERLSPARKRRYMAAKAQFFSGSSAEAELHVQTSGQNRARRKSTSVTTR